MGRTIARHFFHPDKVGKSRNFRRKSSKLYFDRIPIKFEKIYRDINVELKQECKSLINKEPCLPQIVVLDKFIDEFKLYISINKRYVSAKYKINYAKDFPELSNLIKSNKYFMYYLHIPKKNNGLWFCEGRFFTLEEIKKTKDLDTQKKIQEFVEKKKLDYMEFLEEWVGLIFHLATEYLLFKKGLKTIFFSCDKCHRPGVFINGELKDEDDPGKIMGTINVVDTIIYNCINDLHLISSDNEKSNNNILIYDESYSPENLESSKEYDSFKNETNGALIVANNEQTWNNLISEFNKVNKKIKFDLIINGSEFPKILNNIEQHRISQKFNRICLYKPPGENHPSRIKDIFSDPNEVIKFIQSPTPNSEIYPTIKLLTFKEYKDKYISLHKLISSHYGQNGNDCFKIELSYLKDFLMWNPNLKIKNNNDNIKIETFLKTLQKFEKVKNNEEYIIKLYTEENGSYYRDFNNWLNILDPLAIRKTSWFIAAVIYSLNEYAKNKNKGIKTDGLKLYRGIKTYLSSLLYYERTKGQLICFPSFTSSSLDFDVAKKFSENNKNDEEYSTIITINYIYKEGFIPTAVDISDISPFPKEKECLFYPYSFFNIKDIQINHQEKKATIELDAIGKKEIIEEKLKNEDKCTLEYNEEGFIDVKIEEENLDIST